MSTAAPDGIALEFGQFRLLERERSLYKNGKLVGVRYDQMTAFEQAEIEGLQMEVKI